MKKQWQRLLETVRGIGLVDRILMLFLAVLLAAMAVQMLTGGASFGPSGSVGAAVRTSAAAIFGYFLSGNFMKGSVSRPEAEETATGAGCGKAQILTVSVVSMVCLLLLLAAGARGTETPEYTGTVSQLREFTASGIGCLVSCGKKQ